MEAGEERRERTRGGEVGLSDWKLWRKVGGGKCIGETRAVNIGKMFIQGTWLSKILKHKHALNSLPGTVRGCLHGERRRRALFSYRA